MPVGLGSTWEPRAIPILPGIFIRTENVGEDPLPTTRRGIVAAPVSSTWGELGVAHNVDSLSALDKLYGSGGTTDVINQALRGGASTVVALRVGSAAVKATRNLVDVATAANSVRLDAKYPGTRGNGFLISLADAPDGVRRELSVYESTTLLQTIVYTPGANERDALVAAVALGSDWITATALAGAGVALVDITSQALSAGTDPTVNGTAWDNALVALEGEDYNVLAAGTADQTIVAAIATSVAMSVDDGKRALFVTGEPTSVALATRQADASGLNHPAIVYVGNGFKDSAGNTVEGYQAAARVAGMIAGSDYTASLTAKQVLGATAVVGVLGRADTEDSLLSGMLTFGVNAFKQVVVTQGINTLTTLSENQDAGWKKIRRVRTRYNAIDRIVLALSSKVGSVNNNAAGQISVISAIKQVLNQMVDEGGIADDPAPNAILDPANPPVGDTATFKVSFYDLDSMERMLLSVGLSFNRPTTAAA